MSPAALITAAQVLDELERHKGKESGIHVRDLVACITNLSLPAPALERRAREFIAELRMVGHPICGKPEAGYFIAATVEELEETFRYLRARAISSLLLESRMRKVSLPALIGQINFFNVIDS
ncbi:MULTISPECIES: hypothetical protein [unclassified Variovorax]|uniref:hypothetical protein n=1 Tax=unclassified Variovorax TaxID=663243 RepID=UPI003F47BD5F